MLVTKVIDSLLSEGCSGLKRRWVRVSTPGNDVQVSLDGRIVSRNDYTEWLRLYGTTDEAEKKKILGKIEQMSKMPVISIIMPVYNPNVQWLREAVESVRNQLYGNWQLCIADDCSSNLTVRQELERFAQFDKRIRVTFRAENGHISAASNSAIELATGEWLALMDQDDLLSTDALYYVADSINRAPEAALIYSDEDKIDEAGKRFDPYFKSDWNPDLFLSHNMVSHLGVYRTDIVKAAGSFRKGYEGSQDYDLALRIIEQLTPDQIIHIPRVLYHWRSHSESTAQASSNKNYAATAGQRALQDHFKRTGVNAEVELLNFGMYRVHYALQEKNPLVSLIIPTRNGFKLIKQCIESIVNKTTYDNFEIIIIDNNSDDAETVSYLDSIANNSNNITVIKDNRPFNYSALNNNAIKKAGGEYICLVNNDIEVISSDWLSEMISIATQPGVGAVGACLWYPNNTLKHGGVIIGLGGVAEHSHKGLSRNSLGYFGRARLIQSFSAVTAACLVISKRVYDEVGGLNERELTVAFNDIDLCLKVRAAGYRNVWTPYAELYHHESATRGHEITPLQRKRFEREISYMKQTWKTDRWNDPAYNPNLALDRGDYSLAWPPRLR